MSTMQFIGKIIGKILIEGILIDVRFASFFWSKIVGRTSICMLL